MVLAAISAAILLVLALTLWARWWYPRRAFQRRVDFTSRALHHGLPSAYLNDETLRQIRARCR